MLSILEVVEFKWTISQVLEQDETWMDDILELKSIGEGIHASTRKKVIDG